MQQWKQEKIYSFKTYQTILLTGKQLWYKGLRNRRKGMENLPMVIFSSCNFKILCVKSEKEFLRMEIKIHHREGKIMVWVFTVLKSVLI